MLRDEIVPYTGSDGLVWSSLNGPGGNGVLYTAEYYVMLNRLAELEEQDHANWDKVMVPCTITPGLIQRSSTDFEQEGPDDYVGYLAAVPLGASIMLILVNLHFKHSYGDNLSL